MPSVRNSLSASAIQSARERFSDRQDRPRPEIDSTDFRNSVPRFSEENRKANQALVDVISSVRGEAPDDSGPDRTRVAACEETVDRSDSRDHQAVRALKRILEPSRSSSRRKICVRLKSRLRQIKLEGARYPEFHQELVGR